jgi:hypothetical protein
MRRPLRCCGRADSQRARACVSEGARERVRALTRRAPPAAQVQHECSKYRDWQGICPVSNPRIFQMKYTQGHGAANAKDLFATHAEARTLRRSLLSESGPDEAGSVLGAGRIVDYRSNRQ